MKCHTNDNSTSSTQLPHKFSYIVAILGHSHFESPNILSISRVQMKSWAGQALETVNCCAFLKRRLIGAC
jgi:metal-responsive CopG/Arc/MetJ family transcriptional regulator